MVEPAQRIALDRSLFQPNTTTAIAAFITFILATRLRFDMVHHCFTTYRHSAATTIGALIISSIACQIIHSIEAITPSPLVDNNNNNNGPYFRHGHHNHHHDHDLHHPPNDHRHRDLRNHPLSAHKVTYPNFQSWSSSSTFRTSGARCDTRHPTSSEKQLAEEVYARYSARLKTAYIVGGGGDDVVGANDDDLFIDDDYNDVVTDDDYDENGTTLPPDMISPLETITVVPFNQTTPFPLPSIPITIPTYVHILRRDDGSGGPSDDQIEESIDLLNLAYSPMFLFQFDIMTHVTYTDSSQWYEWKHGSKEEVTAFRELRRGGCGDLNVFVAVPQEGVLGYASFPWECEGDAEGGGKDGVVILNGSLPRGNAKPYDQGHTLIHEVGHWLGLFHTFENGCDGKIGDSISSTPAEDSAAYGCPLTRDSCPHRPGLDPVTNYMDYSDDNCTDHFNEEQMGRMVGMWLEYRSGMKIPGTEEETTYPSEVMYLTFPSDAPSTTMPTPYASELDLLTDIPTIRSPVDIGDMPSAPQPHSPSAPSMAQPSNTPQPHSHNETAPPTFEDTNIDTYYMLLPSDYPTFLLPDDVAPSAPPTAQPSNTSFTPPPSLIPTLQPSNTSVTLSPSLSPLPLVVISDPAPSSAGHFHTLFTDTFERPHKWGHFISSDQGGHALHHEGGYIHHGNASLYVPLQQQHTPASFNNNTLVSDKIKVEGEYNLIRVSFWVYVWGDDNELDDKTLSLHLDYSTKSDEESWIAEGMWTWGGNNNVADTDEGSTAYIANVWYEISQVFDVPVGTPSLRIRFRVEEKQRQGAQVGLAVAERATATDIMIERNKFFFDDISVAVRYDAELKDPLVDDGNNSQDLVLDTPIQKDEPGVVSGDADTTGSGLNNADASQDETTSDMTKDKPFNDSSAGVDNDVGSVTVNDGGNDNKVSGEGVFQELDEEIVSDARAGETEDDTSGASQLGFGRWRECGFDRFVCGVVVILVTVLCS